MAVVEAITHTGVPANNNGFCLVTRLVVISVGQVPLVIPVKVFSDFPVYFITSLFI